MKKRVVIVHGWSGYPAEGWFPWLKAELKKKGFAVQILKMPHSENPKIGEWVSFLNRHVKNPDEQTYFVGHSIGCQTILRYLARLKKDVKVGGAVFVAGWLKLKTENLDADERQIARPWLATPIDFAKVKKHCRKFVCVFSDNDDWVQLSENRKIFKDELSAMIIVEKNKGHFSGGDGVRRLPAALKALLSFLKK